MINIPKTKEYKQNFNYLKDFINDCRQHQLDAFECAKSHDKGQIISPCGTGKTRIQISIIADDILKSGYGIFKTDVIASHRLILNGQLLKEAVDVFKKAGVPFNILFLGTGERIDSSDNRNRSFNC